MNITLVAERYARALFDLALEKNLEDEVFHDSELIFQTCAKCKDLRLLLKSPIISTEKKQTILREIFKHQVQDLTLIYLLIMARKKREMIISEVAFHLVELYKVYKNILTVHFKSPLKPNTEIRQQVVKLMANYSNMDIELKEEIDASLVGGFILNWQDKQYDASIRREIDDMKNAMAKINLYKKGF
ncbi:MAG: ATP synthase F1 subunit delta [Bacteroidales bacterium]|nr:ATP synthase F1 subunit delta [Bacteroidales bacterium]MDD4602462.1 ATP synthase F1 subunit delta [Bacteroidales bacterium]